MSLFLVPTIFGTTILSVGVILVSATILGRALASFFPFKLRSLARFYLAPVMGLATLLVAASWMGRFLVLGNSVLVPLLVGGLIGWALFREKNVWQAIRHGLCNSVFGFACGISILAPLFIFGGFNSHNDAFTYLAHSNWLQSHAFSEFISAEEVTPLTTQIALYQKGGYRMGASFLLALVQSLLNLKWSYEVYPSIMVSSVTACCLACGFPLAKSLRSIPRKNRFKLLALPSFTIGGLIFGANFGFLAQTVGLSMSAGLLFALGSSLRWISANETSVRSIMRAAVPLSVLLAATVFAYSEIAPFILLTLIISAFFMALRYRIWKKVLLYLGLQLGLASIYLNYEIFRLPAALKSQASAVVGGAVNWLLLGYFAHVLGWHGGAWDEFQWTLPQHLDSPSFFLGMIVTGVLVFILIWSSRCIIKTILNGDLFPSAVLLVFFFAGFCYFRYFVATPFATGVGQSWSQFKLSEWAHPFVMSFSLLALGGLLKNVRGRFAELITIVFLLGLTITAYTGVKRFAPLIQYYGRTRDLNKFYHEFRMKTLSACNNNFRTPIYLSLNGQHQKFRQMATYFLPDRAIASDWMDDCYISAWLPIDRRKQAVNIGDCVVEATSDRSCLVGGATIGPFTVGLYDGCKKVEIINTKGAYVRESEGANWWHWVEKKVLFQLKQPQNFKSSFKTKLQFEYCTRGLQILNVHLVLRDGTSRVFPIESKGNKIDTFDKTVDVSPSDITELSIETDGRASPISRTDMRSAAWMIRNVNIVSIPRQWD